jgi:hypothetical protein
MVAVGVKVAMRVGRNVRLGNGVLVIDNSSGVAIGVGVSVPGIGVGVPLGETLGTSAPWVPGARVTSLNN